MNAFFIHRGYKKNCVSLSFVFPPNSNPGFFAIFTVLISNNNKLSFRLRNSSIRIPGLLQISDSETCCLNLVKHFICSRTGTIYQVCEFLPTLKLTWFHTQILANIVHNRAFRLVVRSSFGFTNSNCD